MARKLRYHPLFEGDVKEAANWYDSRSLGLGDAFVDRVETCIEQILGDPERFGQVPNGCRYLRVKRFPYVVLFDLHDDEIIVMGVLHTARSMDKWRERLKND